MDEEITIIDSKTRNEKIKNFLIEKKKILISILGFIIILILSFYTHQMYKDNLRHNISDKYNAAVIQYNNGNQQSSILQMKEIVENRDSSYSPLALYFLIDNKLIDNKNEVNEMFDVLIDKTSLQTEIKNLIIYKKALYNSDFINEDELLDILRPIINSNSVWKSHALYLLAEYFYSKDEKQKSKEFFNKIISLENANNDIAKEAQKRLIRDLSE
tara:strand:+ start:80 stop:724 length:645 start_codon:yes stop_codon:yes gene_type:complete